MGCVVYRIRTEFRYGSAQVAKLMPIYDQTPGT